MVLEFIGRRWSAVHFQVARRGAQHHPRGGQPAADLAAALDSGSLSASELLHRYCALLHARLGTYEAVARRTGLDRRTAKKYVTGDM